jgi:hypothetical protein
MCCDVVRFACQIRYCYRYHNTIREEMVLAICSDVSKGRVFEKDCGIPTLFPSDEVNGDCDVASLLLALVAAVACAKKKKSDSLLERHSPRVSRIGE